MTIIQSVHQELKNTLHYAELLTDGRSEDNYLTDPRFLQLQQELSRDSRTANPELGRTSKLREQPYLKSCHEELVWAWNEVSSAAQRTRPPVPLSKIKDPMITVAPTGSFNAVSLKDISDNTALVFDESPIGVLYAIALHCGNGLFNWIESYVAEDMDRFALGVTDIGSIGQLHRLLSSVVTHGFVTADTILDCVHYTTPPSYRLGLLIYFRLMHFLMGHEFSHFVYDHHGFDRASADWNSSGLFGLLNESLERKAANFGQLPEPTEEQKRNFLFDQFHEFQADEQSLTFLAVSGGYNNVYPEKRRLFAVDMAAIAVYLMICVAIERMVFIRIRGRDPAQSALYSNEFGVQNLCLRTSHPSPSSRLAWLKTRTELVFLGGHEGASDFFFGPVERYFGFAVGLDRTARKYLRFEPQLVAKKWASRYSNAALLAAMWPGEEVPNLMEFLAQLEPREAVPKL